jgi:hypothetical protein
VSHGKVVCACGVLIMQCRCIQGHAEVTVAPGPCQHGKPATPAAPVRADEDAVRRAKAACEADGLCTRWVPNHMTARRGLAEDIAASLFMYWQLGVEAGIARAAKENAK